jgi:hypothetical protein
MLLWVNDANIERVIGKVVLVNQGYDCNIIVITIFKLKHIGKQHTESMQLIGHQQNKVEFLYTNSIEKYTGVSPFSPSSHGGLHT